MDCPVDYVKPNNTANLCALVRKQDFELDSKFDFLYSKFFKQSSLSGLFNTNPVLMGNTII
jgi:hypothetical protein